MSSGSTNLSRPQWQVIFCIILAALLLAVSFVIAALIPIPGSIPAVALNSKWVFRGEVLVACPVAFSIIWVVIASVVAGHPPRNVSGFGLGVSSQVQEAKEELVKGSAALEAAHKAALGTGDDREYQEAMASFWKRLAILEAMTGGERKS